MANTSPYSNSVILDNDALNKLIELNKSYCVAGEGTGIKLKPGHDTNNIDRL